MHLREQHSTVARRRTLVFRYLSLIARSAGSIFAPASPSAAQDFYGRKRKNAKKCEQNANTSTVVRCTRTPHSRPDDAGAYLTVTRVVARYARTIAERRRVYPEDCLRRLWWLEGVSVTLLRAYLRRPCSSIRLGERPLS